MIAAFRSVFVINRGSLLGTAVIVALTAALLTATAQWLEAGIRDEALALIVVLSSSFAGTVVIIAVLVVSGTFSGALRLRRREFALLRAIGATAAQVRMMIAREALAVLLVAAPLGIAGGTVLAPRLVPLLRTTVVLPEGFVLPFSVLSVGAALLIVAPTALLAASLAAGRILRVSPTAAVRESAVDAPVDSRVRLLTAVCLAVVALVSAATPFLVPGTIGSASAAMSAILLVIAASLAGPVLVHRVAVRGTELVGRSQGPARVLAFANARGFSRRLSASIVPLVLLIALGSVQSGTNASIARASDSEVRAGVQADLVVQSAAGVTPRQAGAISSLPGVASTLSSGQASASVRTEPADEDFAALGDLEWEPETITTISAGDGGSDPTELLDPGVVSGSLRDLRTAGTVAVARGALLFTGKGIGDTIDVRLTGDKTEKAEIVAVYERELGFGSYLMAAPDGGAETPSSDAVLVDVTAGAAPEVRTAITGMGLTVTDGAGYARTIAQDSGGQQLSLVLLIALLGLVAAAAANTLMTSTSGRRDEFELLARLGATRTQVMGMVVIETGLVILTAVVVGILTVVPALLGVAQGMLGTPVPVFDVPVTAALIVAAAGIAVLAVIPAAMRATSRPA